MSKPESAVETTPVPQSPIPMTMPAARDTVHITPTSSAMQSPSPEYSRVVSGELGGGGGDGGPVPFGSQIQQQQPAVVACALGATARSQPALHGATSASATGSSAACHHIHASHTGGGGSVSHASCCGATAAHTHAHSSEPPHHCSCSMCHHHSTHRVSLTPQSWANVVPVPLLARWTALVECPGCKAVAPTVTTHTSRKGTHWMAAMFFFTTGVGVFIPYMSGAFKDVDHVCMRCGRHLATARFGGGTKAHLL